MGEEAHPTLAQFWHGLPTVPVNRPQVSSTSLRPSVRMMGGVGRPRPTGRSETVRSAGGVGRPAPNGADACATAGETPAPRLGRPFFATDGVFDGTQDRRDVAAIPGAVLLVAMRYSLANCLRRGRRTPAAPGGAIDDFKEL